MPSTRINIVLGNESIIDANTCVRDANRSALMSREQEKRTTIKAQQERQRAQETAGNPNLSIYAPPFDRRPLLDKPIGYLSRQRYNFYLVRLKVRRAGNSFAAIAGDDFVYTLDNSAILSNLYVPFDQDISTLLNNRFLSVFTGTDNETFDPIIGALNAGGDRYYVFDFTRTSETPLNTKIIAKFYGYRGTNFYEDNSFTVEMYPLRLDENQYFDPSGIEEDMSVVNPIGNFGYPYITVDDIPPEFTRLMSLNPSAKLTSTVSVKETNFLESVEDMTLLATIVFNPSAGTFTFIQP